MVFTRFDQEETMWDQLLQADGGQLAALDGVWQDPLDELLVIDTDRMEYMAYSSQSRGVASGTPVSYTHLRRSLQAVVVLVALAPGDLVGVIVEYAIGQAVGVGDGVIGVGPVSYTHLDVYKRQTVCSSFAPAV